MTQKRRSTKSAPKPAVTIETVDASEVPEELQEPKYTIREHKIDRFTTLRTIVPIGRVTCPVCGYDPVVTNAKKFMTDKYDELDDEGKLIARNIFKKHMLNHSDHQIEAAKLRNKELKP